MKKILHSPFPAFVIAAMLFMLAATAYGLEEPGAKSLETIDVDGTVWMNSDRESKLNFLLGVENAIAMECALADAVAARDGTPTQYSMFQQGWMQAFDTTGRSDLVTKIDSYYRTHPAHMNRHVFDVVWNEMIRPAVPVIYTEKPL